MDILWQDYFIVAAVVGVVLTLVGLFVAEKAGELRGALVFLIPAWGALAGIFWPIVMLIGGFAGTCYTLTTVVKKISNWSK